MSIHAARRALLTVCCLSLVACSGGSNSRIDYKEAKTLPALEVPPDLAGPVNTGVEDIPELVNGTAQVAGGTRVLPRAEGIEIARDGSARWLVIEAVPSQLWPRLREFWATLGLELKLDDASIGIMETAWAENRADAPGGFLTGMVRKVFKNAYSADTRDKYRLRLEPLADGRSEVYITHYGLKEIVAGQTVEGFTETAWETRPSDPELANEILNRLVVYLGGNQQTAAAVLEDTEVEQSESRSRIVDDMLLLEEGFSRAWRLTGLTLDRIGMVVDDRNRSEGLYYVSGVDQLADADLEERGWFSSLFSSDDGVEKPEKLQVHLSGDDATTRIRIRNEQGTPLSREQALPILQQLQESLP
ncbi:MAG: outer membrane protein assembly factor BamC [Gammaproteobacteria bacterium]|nr:outer membrane protein assembly factor BamC [Gammaproteobacteria bacterium]MCW8840521.1 outer membrane protein assembly factor BamC [Gammaproteobacteria bacterium]MCW8927304.1 outer membrane protein assembly factor BamC [Gammaproteobacteria bacterium]MCW8959858.1 outer membrane protein assembly factor BamC [Gammaproteobacteria bacterium]MCW8973430.1 outer membrane protein assembly factor BamC [Gammaproteobacteria bacterium]